MKPGPSGALRPAQQASENPGSVITSTVMSDLPFLSMMLSRLFESSQYVLLVSANCVAVMCYPDQLSLQYPQESTVDTGIAMLTARARLLYICLLYTSPSPRD